MRSRFFYKTICAAAAVMAALTGLPADAAASHRKSPVRVAATITACRGERLTIAVRIEPAADRANQRALRAVRRAKLQLRVEAAPLYGASRKSRKFKLGRTTSARRSVRFADLPAQSYGGIVRYRWARGKRTVLSGQVRTRKAKVAGRRGRAFCSLRFGKRPRDTTPPQIVPIPNDFGWQRGPLQVRFFVVDDLSGVALVVSRVDGGSLVRGRTTTISGEGEHRLEYVARDAAGNQTPVRAVTLRVDEAAPTTPTVTGPSGTTSSTPEITWDASTDSASGVAGYVALVRDSGGAIVWSQTVPASTTSVTVGQSLGPGSYTAEVVAFDGAAPQPFTATGASGFTVP